MTGVAEERRIDAHGMTLAARHWRRGCAGKYPPLITVHGWLDNAASFDALGEALDDFEMLALDLPGHGLSDHKHVQGTYNIWDDHLQILAVADACGWEQFVLVGHSRGAMIATLLAAAMPERVVGLVCLDGFLPYPLNPRRMPEQLGRFLRDYRRTATGELRGYASIDEAIAARARAVPTREDSARRLLERGMIRREDRWHWRSDRRLRYASALKLTGPECDAVLEALTMPVLLVLSPDGYAKWEAKQEFAARNPKIDEVTLDGSHHQHMEEQAHSVASFIASFVNTDIG